MRRPQLEDDIVFETVRSIVIAEWENVVFGQYLTVLIGSANPYPQGHLSYDASVDPSITNAFATAAFRYGHTLIQGLNELFSVPDNAPLGPVDLKVSFFNSTVYEQEDGAGNDQLLNGQLRQPARQFDQAIAFAVTNFLFANQEEGMGSDLAARNINRARDHGIPGYTAYRDLCGLSKVCSFDDRPPEITETAWHQLKSIYANPQDIDLFVGGIAEESAHGGTLGATFACIVGLQFTRLIQGDRFFFTHSAPHHPHPFTEDQKKLIKARNMGDIICDTTQLSEVRENVFLLESPFKSCEQSTKLDVEAFLQHL